MLDFISIFYLKIVLLTNDQKETIVIEMLKAKRPIREIAKVAQKSFSDIGEIKRRISGESESYKKNKKLSKVAQALELFSKTKTPIKVAIELDLSANEIEEMQQEFWVLTKLDELALVYMEIRNYLDLFLNLFHVMKINKMINKKDIETVLKYAADLPSLENKFRNLANTVLDLEIKKKELSAQLLDLAQAINRYQITIDNKKITNG